ncbi:ATP-binding protein [Pontixanthobacter sp. CEM42]|uniref:sensor histidine kinase n=1 Tax=Pontixanthobacter sp. CEM42 TaxID=2792077 RepID=UPI001ADEC3AB|nr:ATP-binding protein [Pontixanthobacter sp. CEM42]
MSKIKFFSGWYRIPHLARLSLAVLLVQLVFWILVKPAVIGTPNPEFETIDGYSYEETGLEAPTYASVEQAKFESIEEMPAWHCCERGYRAFRYQFDLDTVPESGLGIDGHVRADNLQIYVNGTFVAGSGRMESPDHTYDSLFRKTYHIPSDVVSRGRNQVTFIMVRDGIPYFDYFKPILGEYFHIKSNMERTEFLSNGYSYLLIAAIAMVALFSLIFFLISGREGGALWLFVLATSFVATSHYYIWSDPPFDGQARIAYFFSISLFSQFAWFGWADSWSRDYYRWSLPAAAIAGTIALAGTLYCLYFLPYGAGYDQAGEIVFYCGIAFAIATAIRLVWSFRDLKEDRYWEAAIALLLVSLLALQAITEMTQALNMGYTNRTTPFLIIGIAIAFFARRVTLFRSSSQINSLLQSQLDERTGELAVAHGREKRLVRQQALDEERQRIMRDMHDGLGSHLMSMMMMAKRGNGKHSDYADGLQSVIDEMRLMIDSMDSVGESLRSALAIYKKRIVPRAQEAGFSVSWTKEPTVHLPDYSPREVLQVFRILQEALTNALKHSGGDAISVTIESEPSDPASTRIVVADNGKGIEMDSGEAQSAGRGLKNMRVRAAAIGAEIDIEPARPGIAVVLTLVEQ